MCIYEVTRATPCTVIPDITIFSLKQSVGEHLKVLSGTDEGLGTLRLGEKDKRFLS